MKQILMRFVGRIIPNHRISLTRSRLAIGKDSSVDPKQKLLDRILNQSKHIFLRRLGRKNIIETHKGMIARSFDLNRVVLNTIEDTFSRVTKGVESSQLRIGLIRMIIFSFSSPIVLEIALQGLLDFMFIRQLFCNCNMFIASINNSIYYNKPMLRKQIRLRREYLYTLQHEKQQKTKMIKKQKLLNSKKDHSRIPTQLFKEKDEIEKELPAYDINTLVPSTHQDDQYANVQYVDPQILLTTSRDPSSRLLQFQKQMAIVLPNTSRINRGGYVMKDLVDLCLKKGLTDLILLHEHRGQPDGLIVCHMPVGPTVYFGLQNVVLRHDVKDKLPNMPEIYPHLVFHNFSTELGQRVVNILKHLFPVPKVDSKRCITMANSDDLISFRHHTFHKENYKTVGLQELGPRFEMKLYQISLGLVTQIEAQKEWVLRPFMNTATKRKAL